MLMIWFFQVFNTIYKFFPLWGVKSFKLGEIFITFVSLNVIFYRKLIPHKGTKYFPTSIIFTFYWLLINKCQKVVGNPLLFTSYMTCTIHRERTMQWKEYVVVWRKILISFLTLILPLGKNSVQIYKFSQFFLHSKASEVGNWLKWIKFCENFVPLFIYLPFVWKN